MAGHHELERELLFEQEVPRDSLRPAGPRRFPMTEQTRKPFVPLTLNEQGSLAQVTLVSNGDTGGGIPT